MPDIEPTSFDGPKIGSERNFGITFGVVSGLFGLWPLLSGGSVRPWLLVLSFIFFCLAIVVPRSLAVFNKLWFRFGLLLGKVITPIVMAFLFFTTITPLAFILRLAGKDLLRLRFEPDAISYWQPRIPTDPSRESFKDQF
jgi:hypothetical protein